MTNTFDDLAVRAEQHQRELRHEAEVARLVERRTLASGRAFRIVLPTVRWPRVEARPTACLEA